MSSSESDSESSISSTSSAIHAEHYNTTYNNTTPGGTSNFSSYQQPSAPTNYSTYNNSVSSTVTPNYSSDYNPYASPSGNNSVSEAFPFQNTTAVRYEALNSNNSTAPSAPSESTKKPETWNGVSIADEAGATYSSPKKEMWHGGRDVVTIEKKEKWNGDDADTTYSSPKKQMWHGGGGGVVMIEKKEEKWNGGDGASATYTSPKETWRGGEPTWNSDIDGDPAISRPTKETIGTYNYTTPAYTKDQEPMCACPDISCDCDCDCSCDYNCDTESGAMIQKVLASLGVLVAIAINIAVIISCYQYGQKGDVRGYAIVASVVSAAFIPVWFIAWYANKFRYYKCCTNAIIIPIGILFPLFAGLFGGFAGYTADLYRIAQLPPYLGTAADVYGVINSGELYGGRAITFPNTTYLLTSCMTETIDYSDGSDDTTTYTYLAPIVDCTQINCNGESNIPVKLYAIYYTTIESNEPGWDPNVREALRIPNTFGFDRSGIPKIEAKCTQLLVDKNTDNYELVLWQTVDSTLSAAKTTANALYLTGLIAPSGIFFIFLVMGAIFISYRGC